MQTQQVDLYSDSESEVERGEICGNIIWKGNHYPIYDGENILGREEDCDVRIEHDSVSLKHAVLDFEEGVARIRDLKSKNGTSVESDPGGGSYIKLGPTKRNVEVKSGCKLRFGLVDCKYIALSTAITSNHGSSSAVATGSAAPAKSALKYDCETQFLNVPLPEDSDEDTEEGNDKSAIDKQFSLGSVASSSLRSKTSVLEAETQIDHGLTLNSAEKAPIPGTMINTPSSLIKTKYEDGIACLGTPGSRQTTPGGVLPRTATSPGESSAATTPSKNLRGIAEEDAPMATGSVVAVTAAGGGDDDCSTDDDLDVAAEEEEDAPVANPYVPTTLTGAGIARNVAIGTGNGGSGAFAVAGAGAGAGADTDASDDEDDDMSQDLMLAPAAQDSEAEEEVEKEVAEGAGGPPVDAAASALVQEQDVPVGTSAQQELQQAQVAEADADTETDVSVDEMSVDYKLAQEDNLSAQEVAQDAGASRSFSRSATGSRDGPPGVASADSPFHNLASAGPFNAGSSINNIATGVGNNMRDQMQAQEQEPEESEREMHSSVFFSAMEPAGADEPALPTHPSMLSMPSIPENRTASPAISDDEEEASEVETVAQLGGETAEIEPTAGEPAAVEPVVMVRSPNTAIKDLLSNSGMPEGVKVFRSQDGGLIDSYRTGSPSLSSAANSYPPEVVAMDVAQDEQPVTTAPVTPAVPASAKAGKGRASRKRLLDSDDEGEDKVVGKEQHMDERTTAPSVSVEAPLTTGKGKGKRARINAPEEELPVEKTAPSTGRKGKAGKAVAFEPEPQQEQQLDAPPVPAIDVNTAEVVEKPAKRGRGKAAVITEAEEAPADTAEPAPVVVATVATAPAKGVKKGRGKKMAAEDEETEAVLEAPAVEPASAAAAEDVGTPTPAEVEVAVSKPPATKKGRGKQAAAVPPPVVEEAAASASGMIEEKDTATEDIAPSAPVAVKGSKKSAKKAATSAQQAPEPEPQPEASSSVDPAAVKGPGKRHLDCEVDEDIRIMFTKVDDAPYAKFLKTLPHVTVTADATLATHCVTLPELKRTPKLMVAINCGVRYVVTEQWIKDSVKAKSLVSVTQAVVDAAPAKKAKTAKSSAGPGPLDARADAEVFQQLASSPYVVQDAEKEKLWGFSMASTLALPRNAPGAVKLFDRLCFFCTKGVCGETAPPADELRTIIESGGGVWLSSLDEWAAYTGDAPATGKSSAGKAKSKSKTPAAEMEDSSEGAPAHALVVLSHPSVVKKEITKKVLEAVARGVAPASGVYSMELVFLACLKQRVDFDDHRMK